MPLYSTGSNSNGQTSQSSIEDSSNFNLCKFLTSNENIEILDLKFGGTHTLASTSNNENKKEIYVCGCNSKGQLGFQVLSSSSKVEERNKNNNNEILNYTSFQLLPLELLLSTLQPSLDATDYQIEAIAASWDTSFVLLSSKHSNQSDVLLSFGGNDWGELGIGSKGHSLSSPTSGMIHLVDLKKILLEGNDDEGYFKIRKLEAGPRHITILVQTYTSRSSLKGAMKLVGWGVSRHGQLGITNEKILLSPQILSIPDLIPDSVKDIKIGRDHSLLLCDEARLVFLGSIKGGIKEIDLGSIPSTTTKRETLEIDCSWSGLYLFYTSTSTSSILSPVNLATPNKTITALGSNSHSQLAQTSSSLLSTSTLIPISLPSHLKILKLSAGSEHVLVLTSNEEDGGREVWAWGWNEHGNLGDGSKIDCEVPKLVWKESNNGGRGAEEGEERKRRIYCWAGNATSWIYVED